MLFIIHSTNGDILGIYILANPSDVRGGVHMVLFLSQSRFAYRCMVAGVKPIGA